LVADGAALDRFREKLDRELKSGLVSLVLLLVVERSGPVYGYRILQTIQNNTDGRLAFKEGTAYPLLNNLERMGLVSSFWGSGSGGPPRKYYQVTTLGARALEHALDDWSELFGSVRRLIQALDGSPKERPTKRMER
jgi:PadR family transcriptional regulator, regulatory protein PadR